MKSSLYFFSRFHKYRFLFVFFIFLTTTALSSVQAQSSDQHPDSATLLGGVAENKKPVTAGDLFPPLLAGSWRVTGSEQRISPDKLPTGQETSLYLEYGLQSLISRVYTNGNARLTVTALEMKYPSGAYGLWTFNRPSNQPTRREFYSGRYFLRVEGNEEGRRGIDGFVASFQQHLASGRIPDAVPLPGDKLPNLPNYLPEQGRVAESEKYLVGPIALSLMPEFSDLKDLVDFTGGTHAAVAAFHGGSNSQMKVILIEYQTPQFASAGHEHISTYLNALSQEARQQRILRRIGNYVVEAVNVSDPAAAQTLIDKVKYMARVYWEGDRLKDVPLEFRPPDSAALNEAIQTGRFLVAVFYWIGIFAAGAIVTGLLTGGVFFYWRRTQRRRLGLEDGFSDAGGMVRLNLDQALTPTGKAAGLLNKGD
jgi:hypothetical protein